MAKDYCSFFPEYWYSWEGKVIYLGYCCMVHDEKCSFSDFFMCMWRVRVIGTIPIALIAGIACWIRHTKLMIKRWN